MRTGTTRRAFALAALCALLTPFAGAVTAQEANAAAATQSVPVVEPSPAPSPEPTDAEIHPAEPDFVVVNMPTQARLPRGGWAFRVTHRFNRPLDEGDFGELAGDLFGFDGGAQTGLELRYGIARATQIGVHRTSDKTISLFGQRDLVRAADHPFGAALYVAVDGFDNFHEEHAPGAGLLLSRRLGDRGAVYAMPAAVANVRPFANSSADGETAVLLGLGARIRFAGAAAVLVEFTPRLDGADGDFRHPLSFGLEKTVGGHAFQINVSNGFGTTLGQSAQGGVPGDPWYLGFNISRKFY